MMPTTFATRSRKESKLKAISRSGRRRRRYIVRPRFGGLASDSFAFDGRSLLRGGVGQGGIGQVEGTQPLAPDNEADHRMEGRIVRAPCRPTPLEHFQDRLAQQ